MEARGFGDCDLYTFVKFSLLNCLVTDPSVRTADPMARNPIVFASAGFGVMCGCAPHEVIHRNCRFMQSPSFVESIPNGTTMDTIFPQHEAVAHMSAALDARQESLTYLYNFRKDGSPFANLLFMSPILDAAGTGVLFWVGVQHPLGEHSNPRAHSHPSAAADAGADVLVQLRSCQETLHAVQLQELYGSYTTAVQRSALLIQSTDGGAATSMCRLCEQHVLADAMPVHAQYCKIVTQCKTLATCSDSTLARTVVKLNGASNAAAISGAASTPGALVVELLRHYTTVLLSITASTTSMPILASLPSELDRLVAAVVQPATAALWADIRAAGTRKIAALQHAHSWASELQHTIVHMPTSDPMTQGQAPCMQDFEIVREIQRGSHATVWLVRKRQTKDVFAMKVIDKKAGRLNRLHTERKVLFLCSSPFVVKTFYAFEDSEALYLVMERLQQDCKHVLQVHGAMREAHAMPILADMVLALEHLHACGIVHRDLKPENMLLTTTGRLKLADFGLSHVMARAAPRADEVAKDPSIVGTPFYMAPETIRGKARGFEAAADWWSFGVITYEFLLGFPPFQGAKIGEIYRSILSVAFTVPTVNCAVSAESADLINRLLVPDPRRRLSGAAAVMAQPWFHPINWQHHALSAGSGADVAAPPPRSPSAAPSQSLHSLAASGGSLAQRPGLGDGAGGSHSVGSKASFALDADADAERRSVARSVTSGIESERSAASTTLAELAAEVNDTQTWHLDNLMALNDKGVGHDPMDSH
jgi:serine/threonine protein kinase